MAQFIQTANQDLLWNTFQKIPEVTQLPFQTKQRIFRNAVSHFYQQLHPTAILSGNQLITLNKQLITYLIEQARPKREELAQRLPQQQQIPQHLAPLPQFYESTEEKTQRIFSEKQKVYEQMTTKPDLPKPSELFREPSTEDDGAIQNMDELIKQYQEQRDQEVPTYDPISTSTKSLSIVERLEQLEQRVHALESQRMS